MPALVVSPTELVRVPALAQTVCDPLDFAPAITVPEWRLLSGAQNLVYLRTNTNSITSVQIGDGYYLTNSTGVIYRSHPNTSTTTCSNTYVEHSWFYHQPSQAVLVQRQKEHIERAKLRAVSVHRAKGSIKRALKLMDGIGFGNEISVFLGGDSIEVSHPDSLFKFLLTKTKYTRIIDRTISPGRSTPYQLQLYTKTEVHVADLCVYLENTPILDQVLAVSMYIRSGNEEDLLRTANWSRLCVDEELKERLSIAYPHIRNKIKRLN